MNNYLKRKYMMNDSRRDYRGRDMEMDSRNDYAKYNNRYDSGYDYRSSNSDYHYYPQQYGEPRRHMDYEVYGYGKVTPMHQDYGRKNYDYNYDYGMDYNSMSQDYKNKLKEWVDKLKHKDRFGHPMEKIINQARNMGVKFEEYSELEFYAIYLAMVSDYKTIANDYNMYIKMAKDFLEDDDMAVTPSEKVCIYLYEIVLGGK